MKSSSQKRIGYHYNREDLFTAIAFFSSQKPRKYRNIDSRSGARSFLKFINSIPGFDHVNFYGGESGDFKKQVKKNETL
jgi:hypothetical protein